MIEASSARRREGRFRRDSLRGVMERNRVHLAASLAGDKAERIEANDLRFQLDPHGCLRAAGTAGPVDLRTVYVQIAVISKLRVCSVVALLEIEMQRRPVDAGFQRRVRIYVAGIPIPVHCSFADDVRRFRDDAVLDVRQRVDLSPAQILHADRSHLDIVGHLIGQRTHVQIGPPVFVSFKLHNAFVPAVKVHFSIEVVAGTPEGEARRKRYADRSIDAVAKGEGLPFRHLGTGKGKLICNVIPGDLRLVQSVFCV